MALTEKQKYEEILNSFYFSPKVFSAEKISRIENAKDRIVSAYAMLLDENEKAYKKKASYLILRFFVRPDFLDYILKDDAAPYDRRDKRVSAWAKAVKSKGRCEFCGSKEKLEAHHVFRWSEYPAGRIDLRNGLCLCAECHAKQHEGEPAEHLIRSKVGVRRVR